VEPLLESRTLAWEVAACSITTTVLVVTRFALLQRERLRAEAALVVSERRYRELFFETDEARAALAEQNDRLRELDNLKDNLISVVSHELRTPLTSILGYLELLERDRDRLSQRQVHFLEVVDRNAARLLRIVSDLLFMTQVKAGQLALETEALDLSEVVDECMAAALPTARERQISVTAHPCADAVVDGDRGRLRQVLDNLLSNALKFTPRHGAVRVTVATRGDDVVLEVADNGIGIPAGQQQALFSHFFRTDAAIEAAIQGTGLGLSIVKTIVECHGGRVEADSVEGEGATFRVTLPRLASAVEPARAAA
jgi:signal transduction histidine kinase